MGKGRSTAALAKERVADFRGYRVCTVDAFGVRDLARRDEEFTNFAIHDDFPDLIPEREIWVDRRLFEAEGLFYIADALVRLARRQGGTSEERADEAGLEVERALRRELLGLKYRAGRPHRRVPRRIYAGEYVTLPDPVGPVVVHLVVGELVRGYYKTDYTEGGHGYVYRWVPRGQIWVERDLAPAELPYVVAHEYTELRLMRDEGMEYDPAHAISSKVEFALREGDRLKDRLVPAGRKLTRRDLPRLTSEDYFAAVLRDYKRR